MGRDREETPRRRLLRRLPLPTTTEREFPRHIDKPWILRLPGSETRYADAHAALTDGLTDLLDSLAEPLAAGVLVEDIYTGGMAQGGPALLIPEDIQVEVRQMELVRLRPRRRDRAPSKTSVISLRSDERGITGWFGHLPVRCSTLEVRGMSPEMAARDVISQGGMNAHMLEL